MPTTFGLYCGTSASAPVVAGHLASLVSAGYAPLEAAAAVSGTAAADLTSPWGERDPIGGGRLDAAAALAALEAGAYPYDGPTPVGRLCRDAPDLAVVQGADRFETAAEIAAARVAAHGPVATVVLAAGRSPIDAVSAGPAFGDDAVVLLTERDRVPAATRDALTALAPARILLIGGTDVIDDRVVDALAD